MEAKEARANVNPWTREILESLADGEWCLYGDVIDKVMPIVPESVALQQGEYYRSYYLRKQGKEWRPRRSGDDQDTIRTGRRLILAKTMSSLCKNGRVEFEYKPSEKKRRPPSRVRRVR